MNVPLANLCDIAGLSASGIIDRNTKKHARNERLNYVMSCCLSSLKAVILAIVLYVYYRYRLRKNKLPWWDAAA